MQSTDQDQQQFCSEVQELNARWDAAFNAKQPQQLASFYDEAGSVMPAGAAQATGLNAINEFWRGMIAQGIVDHHIESIETLSDANLALQRGKWSAAAVDADGVRQTFGGALLLTYRRQAHGGWKILNHIWNM